ncbi:MAG: hypothetical protein ACWGQW_00230 [bacterium]
MKLNRDRLNNLPKVEVATSCFNLIRVHQKSPPHVQLASACALYLLLCEAFEISPQEVYDVTSKIMREDLIEKESDRQFHAVRDYIKYEIRKTS